MSHRATKGKSQCQLFVWNPASPSSRPAISALYQFVSNSLLDRSPTDSRTHQPSQLSGLAQTQRTYRDTVCHFKYRCRLQLRPLSDTIWQQYHCALKPIISNDLCGAMTVFRCLHPKWPLLTLTNTLVSNKSEANCLGKGLKAGMLEVLPLHRLLNFYRWSTTSRFVCLFWAQAGAKLKPPVPGWFWLLQGPNPDAVHNPQEIILWKTPLILLQTSIVLGFKNSAIHGIKPNRLHISESNLVQCCVFPLSHAFKVQHSTPPDAKLQCVYVQVNPNTSHKMLKETSSTPSCHHHIKKILSWCALLLHSHKIIFNGLRSWVKPLMSPHPL